MARVNVKRFEAQVYCMMCTHTVGAEVVEVGKKMHTVPGQKCPRCTATLDVAAVVGVLEAA